MARRLGELAELIDAELRGDPRREIDGVATLAGAGPRQIAFLINPRYRADARRSGAGALLVGPGDAELGAPGRDLLIAPRPHLALAALLRAFHPGERPAPGVHPTAVIGARCSIDPGAHLGALAVVGDDSRIEAGVVLHSGVVVGRRCRVGAGSVLYPRAVLYDDTEVGARCIIHAGAVLGSDGFGFALGAGLPEKVPQVGRVVLEDDVEVGANTTIDRAAIDETRIGAGTKIDNLVMIAHNVRLGRGCLLAAQTGIAGSTRLGDGVMTGGQVGVIGHLTIGDRAQINSKSAVYDDLEGGHQYGGIPAREAGRWRRQVALVQRLDELRHRLLRLERRLAPVAGDAGGEAE